MFSDTLLKYNRFKFVGIIEIFKVENYWFFVLNPIFEEFCTTVMLLNPCKNRLEFIHSILLPMTGNEAFDQTFTNL